MAQLTTTMAGYPQAARVVQAPSSAGRIVQAGAPQVISSGTVQGATVLQQPTTIRPGTQTRIVQQPGGYTGATTISGAAQARTITATTPVVGAAAGVRQARVISSGTAVVGGAAPVATYTGMLGSQPLVRAGQPVAIGAQVVTGQTGGIVAGAPRPATVISSSAKTSAMGGQEMATQNAYEVKHKDDPQLQNLKELRKTCGLKNVPVNDALQKFKESASDGKLTREQFIVAFGLLLQDCKVDVPEDNVKNAVFDLFDRDDNGVVDMMELICGASLLCTGTEEDKIHAVFNVFDENGDGVISMDEMFKFLTSVFKVVLTPNVMGVMNTMGVTVESPEDLASVTALECFKTADLNHDGRLSVAEFKNWFFAPRNDPSFLFSPVRKLLQ